ncbi:hypothetical protein O3Q50_09395 [Enterococcus lactis]
MNIVSCDQEIGRRTTIIRKKDCDKKLSQSFLRINGVQKLASAVISPAKLKTLGAVFTWLFLLLDAEQLLQPLQ